MGPREIAQSKDINENSAEKAKKLGTAKPKPWESEPYNYEEPKNNGSSSLRNPRQDYVEQNHSPHQDSDSIPSAGDYAYSPLAFCATHELDASASTASDQGTLAGQRSKSEPVRKLWAFDQRKRALVQEGHYSAPQRGYKWNVDPKKLKPL